MLKKIFVAVQLLALSVFTGCSADVPGGNPVDADLVQHVDPYIGTGGHGHTFLGASVPFGAVQVGPNNIHKGWDWCSGYHFSDTVVIGFSHLHLSGTGCADLGDILVMPTTGELKINTGSDQDPESGYASKYSHENETASPEYYSVVLDRYNTKVELTATERVALHRYSFPADTAGRAIFNLITGNGDGVKETHFAKIDDTTYVGYRFSSGWASDQRVFFAVKLQTPAESFAIYDGKNQLEGDSGKSGAITGVINFAKADVPVMVKVALSPVSVENAVANITAEMPDWDFDAVKAKARASWNKELNKFQVKADPKTTKIFYTALYHSMIAPVLFNDTNGDYRGTDKKVYTNPGFQNYSIFSLWDTYRTQHPLLTIYQPERINDMVKSMLAIYQQQGILPIWHLLGNETGTMVGYHAVPVIVDAYFKGFRDYDVELAYKAIKDSAMNDREGVKYLKEMGYIPGDKENEAVAKSLEYAIDDHCIALMAKDLGKMEDYEYFLNRSKVYTQYFDKETLFMRGKMADGSWRDPFDPISSQHRSDDYCEGNAWQYTWLVPHDPYGLVELFGSEEAYVNKLDTLFNMSSDLGEGASSDISGLIGQYAHGNEPSHHTIYMYAFVGQQWKAAQRVRQVLDTLYHDQPDGLSGNEDCGQMSAWYIMSAMGFYPVHPANGVYVFGSPALDEVTVKQPNGKNFTVVAHNNSKENIYIQSIKYNGQSYTKSYITHDMITSGGKLEIELGATPNQKFGADMTDRPAR
ncbi:MAG: GH92 family glycosyl hydrolase [Sedimentisphaerales bacterium]|nr:GH92 family glycosyl hydrolase [Sedimentisphaerales bacterium]